MKKIILVICCVACMLPFFVNSAFANEGYAVHPQQFLPANIISLLSGNSSIFLLDHDPIDGNVSYVSWVSFDYLSELSTDWGSAGVIVYNSTMKAYFIRISFTPTVSESGGLEYCSLGTANGFLLGAKDGGFPSTSQDEYMESYEKHWVKWYNSSSYRSLNVISYDALCQIVLDLDSIQQPAGICRISANSDIYYVIMSTGSFTCPIVENGIEYVFANTGWYYCSPDSAVFAAKASDADALVFINQLCTQIHAKISSLLTTCNTISTKLDTLTSVISNGKVLVDNSDVVSAVQSIPAFDDTDIITAIQSIPAYDDSALVFAVTTISNQITEQFGEYDSTYSFPNFYGQSTSSNKTISGVSSSAFSSINPGSRKLLYSPSGTLTLSKDLVYSGGSICQAVYCSPYISETYGLGYRLNFTFRFSYTQNTPRSESVQFPQVSFTDYSGKTLTQNPHNGTVRVSAGSRYAYTTSYYFPRWDASGNWLGWSGQNDTFQWTSSTYEPSKRVYLTPPESGTYYIYGTSDTAIPVVYASRFTGFLQSQTDRVVNAVGSIPAPTDYTSQLTAVAEKLDALANKSAVDLTTIESTLSTISDKLDNTASDVNNTIINITNDNDYFSVFYITDGDGNTRSVTDFAGALTGASGKLLSLLYRLVFADALGSVDGDLGNMEDFFTSEEPPPVTAAMDGDTAPANEVIDVWAS